MWQAPEQLEARRPQAGEGEGAVSYNQIEGTQQHSAAQHSTAHVRALPAPQPETERQRSLPQGLAVSRAGGREIQHSRRKPWARAASWCATAELVTSNLSLCPLPHLLLAVTWRLPAFTPPCSAATPRQICFGPICVPIYGLLPVIYLVIGYLRTFLGKW